MNILKTILILLCITAISCKEKDSQILEDKKIEDSTNFQITNLSSNGFSNDPSYGGIVFPVSITFKNATPASITNFKISYYIKVIYEDDKVRYFPTVAFFENENEGDEKRLSSNLNVQLSLEKNEVWKSNQERKFDVVMFGNWGPDYSKRSFSKSMFERTPKEITLISRYNAVSVDGEYTETYTEDLLSFWKDYQKEIGLR